MKVLYTPYARKRMIERGIKEADIITTIEFPEYTIKRGEEIETYKKINEKTLKVVYSFIGKFINVITVYYL